MNYRWEQTQYNPYCYLKENDFINILKKLYFVCMWYFHPCQVWVIEITTIKLNLAFNTILITNILLSYISLSSLEIIKIHHHLLLMYLMNLVRCDIPMHDNLHVKYDLTIKATIALFSFLSLLLCLKNNSMDTFQTALLEGPHKSCLKKTICITAWLHDQTKTSKHVLTYSY